MHIAYIPEDIHAEYDFEEPCPWCDTYVAVKIDPEDPCYEAVCPVCGKQLMLCTMCHDEFGDDCDWCKGRGCKRERKKYARLELHDHDLDMIKQLLSDHAALCRDEDERDMARKILNRLEGR